MNLFLYPPIPLGKAFLSLTGDFKYFKVRIDLECRFFDFIDATVYIR